LFEADRRAKKTSRIDVEGADHLYRQIRIENTLEDEKGNKVKLKEGAEGDVTVEADPGATSGDTKEQKVAKR
jgi:hypothetical protein